jgi:propionyl-CoA carboxylase alpha chain
MADEAVHIGPAPATESYLRADKIIAACKQTGAEAVHPGFGFLSEKAEFARQLEAEGIVFIGPNPTRSTPWATRSSPSAPPRARASPSCPGFVGEITGADHAVEIAEEIGYPVMIKASAGGGGKGIRVAWNAAEVVEGLGSVKAEAKGAFGDDRVFLEKFIVDPRHIEIQVLGDKHGHVVHLFERECSIQRRNQKVIEEAPSPLLDHETRMAMGAQAVALAQAVGYDSAGTVEFVAGQDKSFYFLEMNTRLQVEHPVTELITGLDLVEQMIRVAAGEPLAFKQEDLKIDGWAIESRIYAEDPYRKFLPSIGRLVRYEPPAEGDRGPYIVRNDAGVREGDEISMFYDPMIAKLCAWGATREAAIDGQARALEDFHISGLGHNLPFLSAVMDQERFRSGALSTAYIPEEFPEGFGGLEATGFQLDIMTAAAAAMARDLAARSLRGGAASARRAVRDEWVVQLSGRQRRVRLSEDAGVLSVELLDEGRTLNCPACSGGRVNRCFRGVLGQTPFTLVVDRAADGFVLRHRAAKARVRVLTPLAAELHARLPERAPADTSKLIMSPMPGLVVSIDVKAGQEVKEGETVAVIEAMKMQNIIKAERDGVVKSVGPKAGDSVAADDVLVEFG